MSGFFGGGGGVAGLPQAMAVLDITGAIISSVGIQGVTLQFGGQYDFTFTPGFFTVAPAIFAFPSFQGVSLNTPFFAAAEQTAASTAGCTVYVYDTTGAITAATFLYFFAISSA
jgi:hypothetical protein